ncbi:MAG: class I SAM-dependent methyltransferase [Lachnospiraceae bacterium]|nr:class I SAM-dependent methyltransferase [Lachnospiraceae bacterium]
MIRLSKRLQAVANLVSPCETAADIGCDHGFLSIWLIENHVAGHVIAADIKAGPLQKAREHIMQTGLENRIETIQCDGLHGISAEMVIIAGMGGRVMLHILKEADLAGTGELILQPQSEIGMFRRELTAMGYEIVQEDCVIEDEKYYPMMKAVKGTMVLTDTEAEYGPCLLREKHPELKKYLNRQHAYLIELSHSIRNGESEKSRIRSAEIEKQIEMVENAIQCFDVG